jgi:hypothetical protein
MNTTFAAYHPASRLASTMTKSPNKVQPNPHSDSASNQRYGQPMHCSHPHLLQPGELTPGIQASEYARRRKQLMDSLPMGSVVFCSAAELKYMSGSMFLFSQTGTLVSYHV